MNLIKKYNAIPITVKASLWYVCCSILQKGIAFITTPIFTRMMSTYQYGQVTIYNSWLEVFTVFATLNIFYGVYNNVLTKYDDKDKTTSSLLGLCSTITFILFILYLPLHHFINSLTKMSTELTVLMFIEILFLPASRFWFTKQRYEYKYKALVVISILIAILTPLLGYFAVLLLEEKGLAKIISGILVQVFFSFFIYLSLLKKGKTLFNKEYWKYALTFNLPLVPHYLSSTILNQCDRVMIDDMCGKDKAGIYGLAYTIGALTIIINEAIMNSYTPYTYQKLKADRHEDIKRTSKVLVIIVAAFSLCLVILAPEIMWILGGDKYKQGVWIIAPIATSVFFRFLYSLYANIEFYYEENYFIMVASSLCAVVNIVLNYIFIKMYGFLAAGYTTLACFFLYSLAHYWFSSKVYKKHVDNNLVLYDNAFIFVVGLFVTVISLTIMLLYKYVLPRYVLVIVLGITGYIFRMKIKGFIQEIKGKKNNE